MSERSRVILDRTLTHEDIATGGRYLSIPFELAPGTASFQVRLGYDPTVARLDIGCSGPDGWRGWSGGARRRFVVGQERSTWGYHAGPIAAGAWEVVLGLHVVPADGVRAVVQIAVPGTAIGPEPPAPRPPSSVSLPGAAAGRRGLPAPPGTTWLAGDLHAHTLHSDGELTPAQLLGLAGGAGLDFVAVTDHNTTSHHPGLAALGERYGVLAVPGQEVTTHRGHANALGDVGWVDFRDHPDRWLEHVERAGGVLSVNHPVSGDCAWQWSLDRPPHAVEIGHSSWDRDRTDQAAWAWLGATGWAPALVGGGDYHGQRGGAPPGTWVTWVAAAQPSVVALLDGVRAGATAFSRGVDGPLVLRVEDEIVCRDAAGLVLVRPDGTTLPIRSDAVRLPGPAGPHRLETDRRAIVAACT